MATTRICAIVGCDRKHYARGLCHRHYRQLSNAGATTGKTCTIVGCDRGHHARGLCGLHCQQLRNAAAKAARSHPKTPTAPTHVSGPDPEGPDLEAHQRALMRTLVEAAKWTTWGGCQYLVDLLCEAEGVRVLRSSDSRVNAGV